MLTDVERLEVLTLSSQTNQMAQWQVISCNNRQWCGICGWSDTKGLIVTV